MFTKFTLGVVALSVGMVSATAQAASFGYNLRLVVPVNCSVNQELTGLGASSGSSYSLGTFREYCNAPRGYRLVLSYAPGSLRGATIIAGNEQVLLDGSGNAILSQTTGPTIRKRFFSIIPGDNGFDTNQIGLDIVPI